MIMGFSPTCLRSSSQRTLEPTYRRPSLSPSAPGKRSGSRAERGISAPFSAREGTVLFYGCSIRVQRSCPRALVVFGYKRGEIRALLFGCTACQDALGLRLVFVSRSGLIRVSEEWSGPSRAVCWRTFIRTRIDPRSSCSGCPFRRSRLARSRFSQLVEVRIDFFEGCRGLSL